MLMCAQKQCPCLVCHADVGTRQPISESRWDFDGVAHSICRTIAIASACRDRVLSAQSALFSETIHPEHTTATTDVDFYSTRTSIVHWRRSFYNDCFSAELEYSLRMTCFAPRCFLSATISCTSPCGEILRGASSRKLEISLITDKPWRCLRRERILSLPRSTRLWARGTRRKRRHCLASVSSWLNTDERGRWQRACQQTLTWWIRSVLVNEDHDAIDQALVSDRI